MNEEELSDFSLDIQKKVIPQNNPEIIPDFVINDESVFTLYVADIVLACIRKTAISNPKVEIGGILLGKHFMKDKRVVVVIDNIIQLSSKDSSFVHYVFDEYALLDLNKKTNKKTDGYIVGWFHSHIGLIPPFMSHDDELTHKTYFKKSWYVSCIVQTGEESLPLGFWRMDNYTININEYFIHMTKAQTPQEQCDRLLGSVKSKKEIKNDSFLAIEELLQDLDFDENSQLMKIFTNKNESEVKIPNSYNLLYSLDQIVKLSLQIAKKPSIIDEVNMLHQRMKNIRPLEDFLDVVLTSDSLQEKIVVRENHGYTFNQYEDFFTILDFVNNAIIKFNLPETESIIDLSFNTDGSLNILTGAKKIIRFSQFQGFISPKNFRLLFDTKKNTYKVFEIKELYYDPRKLIIDNSDFLWIRTSNELFKLEILLDSDKSNQVKIISTFSLPIENSIIYLNSASGEIEIIGLADGNIMKWNNQTQLINKATLPPHFVKWDLIEVCSTGVGIVTLFNDGKHNQLALFNNSLEFITQFVQDVGSFNREQLVSICQDNFYRGFIRKGSFIYLLSETGNIPNEWYHHPSNDHTKRVYLKYQSDLSK